MTVEQSKNKEALWDAFDRAVVDLRYNSLLDKEKIDLLEDAISRISQLASELGSLIISKSDLALYTEWVRINGNFYRGNLQKNGMELYEKFLTQKESFIKQNIHL